MIKCMNPECVNYNYELEDHLEICPVCKKPTENIQTSLDTRRPLGVAVCIVAIGAFLITLLPFGGWAPFIIGLVVLGACIVTSVIIRRLPAIVVSVLATVAVFGMLAYWGAL